MQIKTVTYQRVKNLGNYESERLEMTAEIASDENPELSAIELKALVDRLLHIAAKKEEDDLVGF